MGGGLLGRTLIDLGTRGKAEAERESKGEGQAPLAATSPEAGRQMADKSPYHLTYLPHVGIHAPSQ